MSFSQPVIQNTFAQCPLCVSAVLGISGVQCGKDWRVQKFLRTVLAPAFMWLADSKGKSGMWQDTHTTIVQARNSYERYR